MAKKFHEKVHNIIIDLLERKPLDEIYAPEIMRETNMTQQAFYYYAKNLHDYLCKRMKFKINEIVMSRDNSIEEIISMMRSILLYFRENRIIFSAMMQSEKHKLEYLECLHESVSDGILVFVNRYIGNLPIQYYEETVRIFTDYVADSIYGVLYRDLSSGMKTDVNDIVNEYKRFYPESFSAKFVQINSEENMHELAQKHIVK